MIISCFQLSSGKHEKLSVLKCAVITQLFPVSLSEIGVVVGLKTLSLHNYFPDLNLCAITITCSINSVQNAHNNIS